MKRFSPLVQHPEVEEGEQCLSSNWKKMEEEEEEKGEGESEREGERERRDRWPVIMQPPLRYCLNKSDDEQCIPRLGRALDF